MSKYASLPGYDQNAQTMYGEEEIANMPEDDRDWKSKYPELSHMKIFQFFFSRSS